MKAALSLKTLRGISLYLAGDGAPVARALRSEVERAIVSAERASSLRASRRQARGEKKAAKREATSEVREAVMVRALGHCECCGAFVGETHLQLDHLEGRARSESVETCWALCFGCHYSKTNNCPSARVWLERFTAHALAHGYAEAAERARRRLEGVFVVREAEAAR